MDRSLFPATAAQALAINRDLRPGQFRQARLDPITEGLGERISIDSPYHVA